MLRLHTAHRALRLRGCDKIEIINSQVLTDGERENLKQESEINRSKGVSLAEEICRKYRREGRFFDEILNMEN